MERKEPYHAIKEEQKRVEISGNKCWKFREKSSLYQKRTGGKWKKKTYLKFWENLAFSRNERRSGTNGEEGTVSRYQKRIESEKKT